MNTSFNVDDYQDLDTFLTVLKRGLSSKGKSLRKKWANSLTAERLSDITLTDYLYYRMLEDDTETAYEVNGTHSINVEEEGGSGAYYIYAGDRRKKDNEVTIEVKPPTGYDVAGLELNEEEVYLNDDNTFIFDMPDENAELLIKYANNVTRITIYYGTSSDTNPTVLNGTTISKVVTSPFGVGIPFNNVGTPAYPWFASPIRISDMKNTIGDQYDISEEFTETNITISGTPYYLYVHKWKTEINKLTFLE